METKNRIVGFKATHPGEILKDEIKERGIKQKEFASLIGMSPSHFNEIIKGSRNISIEIAEKLEQVLGISGEFWLNAQAGYDYDVRVLQKRNENEMQAKAEYTIYNEQLNLKDFCKHLGLDSFFIYDKMKQIKSMIALTSYHTNGMQGLFRKSNKVGLDERQIKTWMCIAEVKASQKVTNNTFSKDSEKELTSDLLKIFNENINTISRLEETFNNYGIKFLVVDKIDGASIDGYSFLQEGVPCIVVTKRYNRIDNLAFSVMHEVAHIYKHLDSCTGNLVHIDGYSSSIEKEADTFAKDTIIPKSLWKKIPIVAMSMPIIQKTYTKWANDNNINPWLVIGRISYETGIYKFQSDDSRNIK